jgi:hypothetical protein
MPDEQFTPFHKNFLALGSKYGLRAKKILGIERKCAERGESQYRELFSLAA